MAWWTTLSNDPRVRGFRTLSSQTVIAGKPGWVYMGTLAVVGVAAAVPLVIAALGLLAAAALGVVTWIVLGGIARMLGFGGTDETMEPDEGREGVRVRRR